MQTLQPRISGTRDYVGDDARALRAVRKAIDATFQSFGYDPIEPPILENSSPFLDRSGEDIRRRMYIFPDPGGRETCLRPELTIPACRAYLRELQASGSHFAAGRETRLCYIGPAFQYESTTDGSYRRQFIQAGVELINAQDREAADAEVLEIALSALSRAGIDDLFVETGDLSILHAFIDGLPVGEAAKPRLRRLAVKSRKDARLMSAFAKSESAEEGTSDAGALSSLLAEMPTEKAEVLIREVLALADVRHVGGRTSEEIVERLIARTSQESAASVSREIIEGIWALLDIRGEPDVAFATVEKQFKAFGVGSAGVVLDRCKRRLALFDAYRPAKPALEFNVGLGRGLEYYTGFVFEIYARQATQIGHLCGGGRYDNLLEALGAGAPVPAVGCAIGVDKLLTAMQELQRESFESTRGPDAIVVAAESAPQENCICVSADLRKAGWSVAMDTSGQAGEAARDQAFKRNIPYLVMVGKGAAKSADVRITRLRDRDEQVLKLADLGNYVKAQGATRSADD